MTCIVCMCFRAEKVVVVVIPDFSFLFSQQKKKEPELAFHLYFICISIVFNCISLYFISFYAALRDAFPSSTFLARAAKSSVQYDSGEL